MYLYGVQFEFKKVIECTENHGRHGTHAHTLIFSPLCMCDIPNNALEHLWYALYSWNILQIVFICGHTVVFVGMFTLYFYSLLNMQCIHGTVRAGSADILIQTKCLFGNSKMPGCLAACVCARVCLPLCGQINKWQMHPA